MSENIQPDVKPIVSPMVRVSRIASRVVTDWRTLLRELAITFVGVLLALIASAWWGEHQDRKRELSYINQLRLDLATTKMSLDSSISYNKRGLVADTLLLGLMRNGRTISNDSLTKILKLPWFGVTAGTMTLGTARAISQGAEGSVIADPALRVLIANYAAKADVALISIEGYAQVARPLADKIHGYAERTVRPHAAEPLSGPPIFVRPTTTITTYGADPEFRAAVGNFVNWRMATMRKSIEMCAAGDSLLARLPKDR